MNMSKALATPIDLDAIEPNGVATGPKLFDPIANDLDHEIATWSADHRTVTLSDTFAGCEYGLFDAESDLQIGDWQPSASQVVFMNLDPQRTYVLRLRPMPPQNDAPIPPESLPIIHQIDTLPLADESTILARAIGIGMSSGCALVEVGVWPGNGAAVSHPVQIDRPLNAANREQWKVVAFNIRGEEVAPAADDFFYSDTSLIFRLPPGGSYYFLTKTADGRQFRRREILTVPSVGNNYETERVLAPDQKRLLERRFVIKPACESCFYSIKLNGIVQRQRYRVSPGQNELRVPMPMISGPIQLDATPDTLDDE